MGTGFEKLQTNLSKREENYHDYEFPKVTIVIPTYNCSQTIATTIESVIVQDYPDFEVVVIDSGSTDRTLEVIKSFHSDKVLVYSVTTNRRYEKLNKGITQSNGIYINFLFPGDFYINPDVLKHMMTLALSHDKPELIFCGTLLRDGKREVKTLYRHLSIKLLKKGQQPTSLQSVWFRSDIFRDLGKFNTQMYLRGGYELLCRFCLHKNLRAVSTSRVLTDYDLRWVSKKMVIRHFWETLITIIKYFGMGSALHWLFIQKDMRRFTKLWWRGVRMAFLGK